MSAVGFDARLLARRLGRPNARPLADDDARALFTAMLGGDLDALQLGALWMGLRIKGETPAELSAFLAVTEASYAHWTAEPANSLPIVIPSYNGARQLPNLTPLLASLLARQGIAVIVHGVTGDPWRTTSREIFDALGNPACRDAADMIARHRAGRPAFVAIETLAPQVSRLLDLRWRIGARGSIHTVAKMLNPLAAPALRLVSVTHPDYLERMRACFADDPVGALLLRGAEGEAVAHPRRALRMEWIRRNSVVQAATDAIESAADPACQDDCSAEATARWIEAALAGTVTIPPAILAQVDGCARAARLAIATSTIVVAA